MARPPVRHVIYLHGFASSPSSSKARRFADELARHQVAFSVPDLNLPEFETLTVSRMVDEVARALAHIDRGPVALIGSSLGAFVALHAAARDTTGLVDRLVLLAPALDFGGNRLRQLGTRGIEDWRRLGSVPVFHYGWNEVREVGFALYTDAARYDAFSMAVPWPTLVIQGRRDASVDPAMVEAWCRRRPSVELRLVDDEHQLSQSMDRIWIESQTWLGLNPVG